MKRKLFVMVFSILFLGVLGLQAKHAPKHQKKETRIVKIMGDSSWVNTGVRVRPKDIVTIKASGKVYFNNEGQSGVSPDGWDVSDYGNSWPYNWNYCDDPETGMNHAALIGNIGHDNFFIGKKLTFSKKNGTLYLGINDCTLKKPEDFKNSGKFTVIITIVKNGIQRHHK